MGNPHLEKQRREREVRDLWIGVAIAAAGAGADSAGIKAVADQAVADFTTKYPIPGAPGNNGGSSAGG